MPNDLESIASFVRKTLQPAEEIGTWDTLESYTAGMLALAREATRRACIAGERRLLVASFDVTRLGDDEVSSLAHYVEAQSEACDDEGNVYPDVRVTFERLP